MKDLSRHIDMRWLKPPIFLACLAPLAHLVWMGLHDELGANPVEYITHSTGTWALTGLCITLTITPLRRILKQNWLIRFRRMFGLFAFFYACLHFTTWVWIYSAFDVHAMIADVYKRPFITMGFTAFVLLIPLAVTSTSGMIRRLGGRRWNLLHRLIYVSACAGVIHYYWLVKSDETVPLRFAAVVAVLLGYRLVRYAYEWRQQAAAAAKKSERESVYSASGSLRSE
jgi:methionine sulfoxide reductase heme-binding subunit